MSSSKFEETTEQRPTKPQLGKGRRGEERSEALIPSHSLVTCHYQRSARVASLLVASSFVCLRTYSLVCFWSIGGGSPTIQPCPLASWVSCTFDLTWSTLWLKRHKRGEDTNSSRIYWPGATRYTRKRQNGSWVWTTEHALRKIRGKFAVWGGHNRR